MNRKIVIVGGGTAGWMAAAYFAKYRGGKNITVIESDSIPRLGVGESVTPHVTSFFEEIGVSERDWMIKTGATYKYANKFTNWTRNEGETQYYSFTYTFPQENFFKDITPNRSTHDFSNPVIKNIDLLEKICRENSKRFDQYLNPQFHYMEQNTAPFYKDDLLLNQPFSYAHHINAEMAADYLREEIAMPQGVKRIIAKVIDLDREGDNINALILDSGERITGDLFIDCSGWHKAIISKLGWSEKIYEDHPIDRALVCQTDYSDPETEMSNYTETNAEPSGWRFKIGLYHRVGNGYCFSSKHTTEDEARIHLKSKLTNARFEPKLIKWKPSRLEKFGGGNVAAVGLSCGFIEPMEANVLYTIISSIRRLNNVLDEPVLDFSVYNEKMAYTIDDIADFILVHYTLSSRRDTPFWRDMAYLGERLNHKHLILDKIRHPNNSMAAAITGYTMFPDYMWMQLAIAMNIPLPTTELNDTAIEIANSYYKHSDYKHSLISKIVDNNYKFHKTHVFNNLTPKEWEQLMLKGKL
jgi:tryptophan halogenase